jgi:hypothetical protein
MKVHLRHFLGCTAGLLLGATTALAGPPGPTSGSQLFDPPEEGEEGADSEEPGDTPEGEEPAGDEAESEGVRQPSVLVDPELGYLPTTAVSPRRDLVPANRPTPLLEIGDPFLGQGILNRGVELPTGAVWNASLLVYGTFRSAIQVFDDGRNFKTGPNASTGAAAIGDRSEWVNRLDLFVNLRLSPTERFVIGFRPLDNPERSGGVDTFTGYYITPNQSRQRAVRLAQPERQQRRWKERFDGHIEVLFFEGDFGEIFPNLDRADDSALDIGFTIGRQPIAFQQGFLINSIIDAVGVTKNQLRWFGLNKIRLSGIYGMPDVVEADVTGGGTQIPRHDIVGIFTYADTDLSTIEFDTIYRNSRAKHGSGLFFGLGATQRFGKISTAFRWQVSIPLAKQENRARANIAQTPLMTYGHLLTAEIAIDLPIHTAPKALEMADTISPNLVYVNGWAALNRYQPADAPFRTSGTLGRIGILYASPAIGRYGSPLSNATSYAAGGAAGIQLFFDFLGLRGTNVVFEVGGRTGTNRSAQGAVGAIGAGFRVQQRLFGQAFLTTEGFVVKQEKRHESFGLRFEVQVRF